MASSGTSAEGFQEALRSVFDVARPATRTAGDEAKEAADATEQVSHMDVNGTPTTLIRERADDDADALVRCLEAWSDPAGTRSMSIALWLCDTALRVKHTASALPLAAEAPAHAVLRKAFARKDSAPASPPRSRTTIHFTNACGASADMLGAWATREMRSDALTRAQGARMCDMLARYMKEVAWKLTKLLKCERKAMSATLRSPLTRALVDMIVAREVVDGDEVDNIRDLLPYQPRENMGWFLPDAIVGYKCYLTMLNACHTAAQLYNTRPSVHVLYGSHRYVRATKVLLEYIEAHGGLACASIDNEGVMRAAFPDLPWDNYSVAERNM